MAEPQEYLGILEQEPENEQALTALEELVTNGHGQKHGPELALALAEARRRHRERGELDITLKLLDLELALARDPAVRADLLCEKGRVLEDDVLDQAGALSCYQGALQANPEHADAQSALSNVEVFKGVWQKLVKKYLDEAASSTERQLTAESYLNAAKLYGRHQPDSPEMERWLRKAIEVEPRSREAAAHLERLLRKEQRWDELGALYEQRTDAAASKEERIAALLSAADLARTQRAKPEQALELLTKVLAQDPSHPRALRILIEHHTAEQNWTALVHVYENAIKTKARGTSAQAENALALQIGMLYWKKLENLGAAEEHFRRVRKTEPAHPLAIDFYREYHRERNELSKLVTLLTQAQKAETDPGRRLVLGVEIAELSEGAGASAEKAIDAWKGILRQDPLSQGARDALKRLYTRTEKWNALLELLKEEVEAIAPEPVPAAAAGGGPVRTPATLNEARISRLMEVVAIYRDKLNLDVMVINTYNAILALRPDHPAALDALAAKYEQLGRWNDLIGMLSRKADAAGAGGDNKSRAALLRRIAAVWIDRFGNHQQALKPLEELYLLEPTDREVGTRLKEIYNKRRAFRPLVDLLAAELPTLEPAARRAQVVEIAKLAAEKLGDFRTAIQSWNTLLDVEGAPPGGDPEALAALAVLYDKDRRFPALAEILTRQARALSARPAGERDPKAEIAMYERLGALCAERLGAPVLAAEAYHHILSVQPGHPKATRILRDLLVQSGDYAALERLYGGMNAWDDLCDILYGAADRMPTVDDKVGVLTRVARLCEGPMNQPEKAVKAYERMLALVSAGAERDPRAAEVAAKLLPLYQASEKWPRLLSVHEILLEAEREPAARLARIDAIRALCEDKLGSKAAAFTWASKGYDLFGELGGASDSEADDKRRTELERLAHDADAFEELGDLYKKRLAAGAGLAGEPRIALLRALAKVQAQRLYQPDDAQASYEAILQAHPDDPEATAALVQLFQQGEEWPSLLAIHRKQVAAEKDADKRRDLLFRIAYIEEERIKDLPAAAATHAQILAEDPSSARAMRALEKISQARGDDAGLARALELQLGAATEHETKVALELRLGALYEAPGKHHDRARALGHFRAAHQAAPTKHEPIAGLERFVAPPAAGAPEPGDRPAIARLLLPVYEQAADYAKQAAMLEILRQAETEAATRLELDRRLAGLYARRLGDPLNAYEAATRVLHAAPEDEQNRREMTTLAADLGAYDDLALELDKLVKRLGEPKADDSAGRKLLGDLSWQLAELQAERLGQPEAAEPHYRRVLALSPEHAGAYDALERLLRSRERYAELGALLEQRQQITHDAAVRVAILYRSADLSEGVLDDDKAATRAFERVLELAPEELRAYKSLERLYAAAQRHQDLDALMAREVAFVDSGAALELTLRRGQLHAGELADAAGAVDLYEQVLGADPTSAGARTGLEALLPKAALRQRVARLLERVYLAASAWTPLQGILRVLTEFAAGAHDKLELLARIAELEERELGSRQQAFATWCEALRTEPGEPRARAAVERLSADLDLWHKTAEVYEAVVAAPDQADVHLRGQLYSRLGEIYQGKLKNPELAERAYRKLLEVDAGNLEVVRPAAQALEGLFEARRAWPELIDIQRRALDWAEDADSRMLRLYRIAEIQEKELADAEAALRTYREILDVDAGDEVALDALERLYSARKQWGELVEILNRRSEIATNQGDLKARRGLLWRIAEIDERERNDAPGAIQAYMAVLDAVPDDAPALAALARLYRGADRAPDLLEINERRLPLMAPGSADEVELLAEIAALLGDRLGRREEALERWQRVLGATEKGAHPEARMVAMGAVEKLLDDEDLRLRAAEVLEPIYAAEGAHTRSLVLHELFARHAPDVRERLARLSKIAETRESVMNDPDAAFDAWGRAARAALGEPELPGILSSASRLADARGRHADLVTLLKEIGPDVLDAELMLRIDMQIAELALFQLKDAETAKTYYRRVLDAQPDHAAALAALERIYGEASEWDRLYEILVRRAELAGRDDDNDTRAAYLARSAEVAEDKLHRASDACAAYEEILELSPADEPAARALERLYAQSERWVDLAELYEKRLGFADDIAVAVDYRFKLGQIWDQRLSDPERAIENYRAVLGGDSDHAGAIVALERYLDDTAVRAEAAEVLEPIYIATQAWTKLIRIYQIRLDGAEGDHQARFILTLKVARLYEEQLEDLEQAFKWYGKVFREDPAERAIRDQLVRLAGILDQWIELAKIYQGLLDDVMEDSPAMLDVARLAADLYDKRLADVERARACYRRVLLAEPTDAQSFARLEQMLVTHARWMALVEAYQDAIEATLDPELRKSLMLRAAAVYEDKLRDVERAVSSLRGVLEADPDDGSAGKELERLFAAQSRWHDLVDLLVSRLERQSETSAQNAVRMQLGAIYEERLADLHAAIDQYEQALAADDRHPGGLGALERLVVNDDHRLRIAHILEPLYRRHDEWRKLVVILEAQLPFTDDREKRVELLREIGRLHEERGQDLGLAFKALARAWREDVTSEAIQAELERVAGAAKLWPQLIAQLSEATDGLFDPEVVGRLWSRVAVLEEQVGVRPGAGERAIEAWRKVLAARDDDAPALEALERLLAVAQRPAELVRILERRAELATDDDSRKRLHARAAELYESALQQESQAVTSWRNVLAIDDGDGAALDALERLYERSEAWRDLSQTLARKLELGLGDRRALAFKAAAVHEQRLNDSFEAVTLYKGVLETAPADGGALAELDRLYVKDRNWGDLVEIIDRRAALASGAERASLRQRAAEVTERELGEAVAAIGRYRDVLGDVADHAGARAALDRLLRTPEFRSDAAQVLEPLYRNEGAWDRLVELRELGLEAEMDPHARREILGDIAQLHERGRRDVGAAWQAWARALAENAEDVSVQAELERLAASGGGGWQRLAELYEARLEATMDPELSRTLALKLAGIYEETLGDPERAASRYRKALESPGDEAGPLAALDRLYERGGKWPELAEVLVKQAELGQAPEQHATFLFRLGEVRERLGDVAGAVHAYRDVLASQPKHAGARSALERRLGAAPSRETTLEVLEILEPLYEDEQGFARLAELTEVRLGVTEEAGERARLLEHLAEIYEKRLADRQRALDAVARALAEEPRSGELANELERLAGVLGRWEEVAARLEDILNAGTPDEEVARDLGLRAGRIYLLRLGDLARAEVRMLAVLESEPEHAEALSALERIYRAGSDAAKLSVIVARRAELELDAGGKIKLWAEVAAIREEALDDKKGAVAAWKAVLDVSDGEPEALRQLGRLYEQGGQWDELAATLETQLNHLAGDGPAEQGQRRGLKLKLGRLYAGPLSALDQAVEAYRDLAELTPEQDREPVLTALEEVHTRREDWLAVQEVLAQKLELAAGPDRKIAIIARLAKLAEEERDSIDEAVQYWHQALEIDKGSQTALTELARLYEVGERWHDLIDVETRWADLAAAQGDAEDEVGHLVRAADIWERRLGSADAATEILERILARNPRFVPALTTLARIYENAGDWERCLQTLSRAVELAPGGKAAADLYFRLGQVEAARSGDARAAQGYYRKALEYDAGHKDSLTEIERAARERGDHAEVAEILARREMETRDPKQKLLLCKELAELYLGKLGQPQAAVPYLERAAEAAPEDAQVLEPLADAYFAAGRIDQATPLYERLLGALKGKRGKDVARLQFRLGSIKQKRGDAAGALAAFEEAYRLDATHVGSMAGLGEIYFGQGEWEKARRVYRSLLLQNLDAGAGVGKADVYLKLGLIHAKLGEGPKARNMYERGLELEPTHAGIKQAMAELG